MSFSYGSIPPPDSPPLRATPLSPAPPVRAERRAKRHTTIDISLGGLSLNDSPSDESLHLNGPRRNGDSSTGSFGQERAKRQSSAGAIPVPKMINPLPPHYRHPSPAQSSSVPSLTDSRASSTSTHESSTASSASIRSLAPKPSQASLQYDSSLHTISSSDSLSYNCEPVTPTTTTFSRSRLVLFSF